MIDKQKLDDALRRVGNKYLKEPFKSRWTPQCPTIGNCYYVSELLYYSLAPKGSKPYILLDEDNEKHWFIKDPNGKVIDLTADQYDEPPDYSSGKCHALYPQLSKATKELATLLGLELRRQ
jgi:hypothetical protein